jgi:hypothetical protein
VPRRPGRCPGGLRSESAACRRAGHGACSVTVVRGPVLIVFASLSHRPGTNTAERLLDGVFDADPLTTSLSFACQARYRVCPTAANKAQPTHLCGFQAHRMRGCVATTAPQTPVGAVPRLVLVRKKPLKPRHAFKSISSQARYRVRSHVADAPAQDAAQPVEGTCVFQPQCSSDWCCSPC